MNLPYICETLYFQVQESNDGRTFLHDQASSKIRVLINFKCESLYKRWLWTTTNSSLPSSQLLDQNTLSIMETSVDMTGDELSRHLQAELSINDRLLQLPIDAARNRRKLVLFALKKAGEALVSMPSEFNAVKIDIMVTVVKLNILLQPVEEDEVRMRPAAEWAINEFLKGAVVMKKMDCVVCLEDMEAGTEGKKMPCSHVFHENCITRWLRRNHNCPTCRFELPIE